MSELLRLIEHLSAGRRPAPFPPTALHALSAQLQNHSERCWAATPTAVQPGLDLALAGIEIDIAGKALSSLERWRANGEVAEVMRRIARRALLSALPLIEDMPLPQAPGTEPSQAEPDPAAMEPDWAALYNIALHHREHERYYAQNMTESAAELYREANRLRVVAQGWLQPAGHAAPATALAAMPAYAAMGCMDLNALHAIPVIGVLHMEGEEEPSELSALKGKLQATGGALQRAGHWLSRKMDAAWDREQALFSHDIPGGAARFHTIVANCRGSRQMLLAAKLTARAVQMLQGIDMRCAALRATRRESADTLLGAAAMLAAVAQLRAKSGADLASSDDHWARYIECLSGHGLARAA